MELIPSKELRAAESVFRALYNTQPKTEYELERLNLINNVLESFYGEDYEEERTPDKR